MSAILRELPRYRSHKEVQALKITAVVSNPRGFELHFGPQWVPIEVTFQWVAKHSGGVPMSLVGGYFVVYPDGYQSWSPAPAFEGGYTLIEPVPAAPVVVVSTPAPVSGPWPPRPTCHDDDYRTQAPFKFGAPEWRPAGERSYRSCSFCGCIHPEDLLRELDAGATLECADWKYGWPHKFYVSGGSVGHAKWYNQHLKELSPEAFDLLVPRLSVGTGVVFERDERGIKYRGVPSGA